MKCDCLFYFNSLTGVSPFAGENDRSSVLNIRNYNVAFEESMFANLCREAKGFIIKLLVPDRLWVVTDANQQAIGVLTDIQ